MPMLAIAAAAGAASAAFYAALLSGSFGALILAYLAQLPLFVVGLWIGFAGAAIASVAAIVALAVAGGVVFALVYAVANAAPAVMLSYLAQLNRGTPDGNTEWYPAGRILGWLIGIAMAAFFAMTIVLAGEAGGAEGVVRGFVENALRQLTPPGTGTPESLSAFATLLARFFPGVIADSWIVMVVANAVLAQGLLVRFGRNLRPSPVMAQLNLPSWITGATVIAALGSFTPGLAGFLGGNIVLISLLAYAFAGLAVVHALAARTTNRNLALVATYVFVFIFGWPLVIIALIGAAEPWLNLRRRFGGSGI